MTDFKVDSGVIGPGTQPGEEDGAELAFMSMPQEMTTYRMPDITESINRKASGVLEQIHDLLVSYHSGESNSVVGLDNLDIASREIIDQVLGEGEVSIVVSSGSSVRIQESVLAGVWRVQYINANGDIEKDTVEIGEVPQIIHEVTFSDEYSRQSIDKQHYPEGVNNAIPLLTELNDKIKLSGPTNEAHVINLTLLPQSDEDLSFLVERLGKGRVTILSRGYGNCRVTSTATRHVWWVQYFNSQDAIILNTLEVTPVPSVVCASREDIEDSAERLQEIRQVYA